MASRENNTLTNTSRLLWQSSLPPQQSWLGMRKPRLTTPLRAPFGRSFQFRRNNSKRILLPCWLTRSTPKYLRRSLTVTSHLKLQPPAPVGSQPSLFLVHARRPRVFFYAYAAPGHIATRCFKRFGGRSYPQSWQRTDKFDPLSVKHNSISWVHHDGPRASSSLPSAL
ncbi:unnamed protein product [Porites evermanni]|uniref:Uncharacterized protein n=1 Tax=Porites evermanni TaxID=104178 RepID=A0ABN8NCD8_9CNID|nr:unnamed protein product [Porites evermanni]